MAGKLAASIENPRADARGYQPRRVRAAVHLAGWIVMAVAFCALLLPVTAQQKGKQHTLTGKVTEVGKDVLTVSHGNIEGFMGAMTMPYKVDKVDILSKVKVGDQIEATVFEDDYTLYNVKVAPPAPAATKDKDKAKK